MKTIPAAAPLKRGTKREDIKTLHQSLPKLSDEEIISIYLRFWENKTIEEIAGILRKSWDETDHLIDSAIGNLRMGFIQMRIDTHSLIAA